MGRKQETLALRSEQVQTYVSFTSFMTAVVVFFTGLLLTQFNAYDISIKVPISFLIFSLFGFLYATLIYTNAAEEITQQRKEKAERSILLGDILSEYLGVYLLVLSIPLVVSAITVDPFLRGVTLIAALGGFSLYQFSHASIIERHFKESYHLYSIALVLFGVVLFCAQMYGYYFVQLALLFIVFLLLLTYRAARKSRVEKYGRKSL